MSKSPPATLAFTNASSKKYSATTTTVDRAGRVCDIQFAARDDQGTLITDVRGWFVLNLSEGGPIGGEEIGQCEVKIAANQWLRFDHPGKYTVTAWTQRCFPEPSDGVGID